MTTNEEIIEQEDIEMAHYKSLTPDEQSDRERSLMDKARKDERNKVLAEIAEKEGKNLFTPVTVKEITELLKFPDTQITMTTLTLHEILDDNTKNTFKKIENQLLEITGCSNPYCQNYPDKEEEWEKLKKEE